MQHARGFRWGRLLLSLETASKFADRARTEKDLLSAPAQTHLEEVCEQLKTLEQMVWREEDQARKKATR